MNHCEDVDVILGGDAIDDPEVVAQHFPELRVIVFGYPSSGPRELSDYRFCLKNPLYLSTSVGWRVNGDVLQY